MRTKKFWQICIPVLALLVGGALGAYVYRLHVLNVITNSPASIYMPEDTTVKIDSTNLPIVFINTLGNKIKKTDFVTAYVKIIDNGFGKMNYGDTLIWENQHINYEGYMAIRCRGNSSYWVSNKKSYAIRALDKPNSKKKKKSSLLNMRKGKKWTLTANNFDKSMIRNTFTYILAQSYMDFVPQSRFCELIVDGIYYGVYSLGEQITADRLKLEKPGNTINDLTGGYLLQFDSFKPNGNSLSNWETNYYYEYPDGNKLSKTQKEYIASVLDKIEKSIYETNDSAFIDNVDIFSMIDYQLAAEFGHNGDAYRLSLFVYKYRDNKDKRLKFCIWDYDLAYGNHSELGWSNFNTWCYTLQGYEGDWWQHAMQHNVYTEALKKRWLQYRKGAYSDEHIAYVIDSLTNLLTAYGAEQRNTNAWHPYEAWKKEAKPQKYISSSYEEEISYLKDWISRRLKWMDKELLDEE